MGALYQSKLNINLPDLNLYKNAFLKKGVTLPLQVVGFEKNGLLDSLPKPEEENTGWPWTEEVAPARYDTNVNWPKISIVTPSYNQGQFIEQTIRSVLLQNYPNLEYIIIDGGSTDNTAGVLEKYGKWISYRQSEKDNGQSHAINTGFSIASGDYYAWVNSDDYYLPGALLDVAIAFINKKVDFIYGYAYNYITSQKKFELIKVPPFTDYFMRFPSLAQPSCFWSAAIHQPIWEELQCSLDYELWLRLVKGRSRLLIKKPLSVANVHDEAKTSNPKMKAAWHADHLLICSADAHGPVNDWNTRVLLNRVRLKILKWLKLY